MKCGVELTKCGEAVEGSAFQSSMFLLLGKMALIQGDYVSAAKLSERAMTLHNSHHVLAQATLLHARSQHAMGQFTEALRHYSQALELKPELVLARYGMSQMHIASGNLRNGATCLEQILSAFLKDTSAENLISKATSSQQLPFEKGVVPCVTHEHAGAAAQLLHALSSQLPIGGKEKSWMTFLFQNLTQEAHPHTFPETFVAIGELSNGRERMEAFKKAIELYRKNIETATKHNAALTEGTSASADVPLKNVPRIPLRVHNNAAAAFYQMYKEKDANWKWCLQQATEHAKRALAVYHEEKPRLSKITLLFNRARTLEENRYYTQAASIYKDIMKSAPRYLEAHIQLMSIFRKMSRLDLAIAQGVESAKNFPNSPFIRTILGGLCLEAGDHARCKEYLYSVVKGGYPNDILAQVLLGMLSFRTAPQDLRFSANEQRAKGHWIKALEHFCLALTADPHCLHAAHGASAVIGEFGRCTEIRNLYTAIVEASSQQHWATLPWSFANPVKLPAAEVNLGHLWYAGRQFQHATQLYQYATELYKIMGRSEPSIQVFLARAQYESRTRFTEAAMTLRRLLHLRPWDKAVKFNLAIVLQGAGVHFIVFFKVPAALPDDSPLHQIRQAIDSIDQALTLHHGLKSIQEEVMLVRHAAIDEQIQLCHEYKQKGEDLFATVSSLLAKQAIQDRINKEEWEAHQSKKAEEKRRKAEEQRKRDAEQEELAKQHFKERAERRALAAALPSEPSPKLRRKRNRTEERKPKTARSRTFIDALNRYTRPGIEDEDDASPHGEEEMPVVDLDDDVEDVMAGDRHGPKETKVRRTLLSDDEDSD